MNKKVGNRLEISNKKKRLQIMNLKKDKKKMSKKRKKIRNSMILFREFKAKRININNLFNIIDCNVQASIKTR